MTRRLEGKKFFVKEKNGVTSIATEEVVRGWERKETIMCAFRTHVLRQFQQPKSGLLAAAYEKGVSHIPITPIFTFASWERMATQPWFTGNSVLYAVLLEYIRYEGGVIEGNAGYVPFSNGRELGHDGPDLMEYELGFITTDTQFRDTFGIGPREVEKWYAEHLQSTQMSQGGRQ